MNEPIKKKIPLTINGKVWTEEDSARVEADPAFQQYCRDLAAMEDTIDPEDVFDVDYLRWLKETNPNAYETAISMAPAEVVAQVEGQPND